jgi:hypothetical protein
LKSIGNIFVTWRSSPGERRVSIGVIKKSATQGVTFHYNEKDLAIAEAQGFNVLENFPEKNKVYRENVIEKFGERIIKSERKDNDNFYQFWEIDTSRLDDMYYMLAMTQGLLATDNLEFLADFNPNKNTSIVSDVAGLSKIDFDISSVKEGTVVDFRFDADNIIDTKAIELLIDGTVVGYVKQFHNRVFQKLKKLKIRPRIVVKKVISNNQKKKIFIKISF